MSIQAQIINLLQDLRQELGLSILFIGHDLSVIEFLCDRVDRAVSRARSWRPATAADLYRQPRHPYTRALLDAAPVPDPRGAAGAHHAEGRSAQPDQSAVGLRFPHPLSLRHRAAAPRWCRRSKAVGNGHQVACIRADELNLTE